ARVDGHAGAQRGVLDRLEQRERNPDLLRERRVLRVLERDDQHVGGDEGRALGAGDADRRGEHDGGGAVAGGGKEDPLRLRRGSERPRGTSRVDERRGEDDDEDEERDQERGHGAASSRSARSATTRMSMPRSSRTIRDSSEPPKISRRRDSSGVPT